MSKVSNLITAYTADSNSASTNFGQDSPSMYWNQPRVPFEYYVKINLENSDVALDYYNQYFVSGEYQQIHPLIKSVDMPSMKIDTSTLNQYNRKRIVQTKVQYDPIKMVFHDVADGKTLAFWQMYYTYYFRDGLEPGVNSSLYNGTQTIPSPNSSSASSTSPNDTLGTKHNIQDVLSNKLVNHNFGYNLLNFNSSWPTQWRKTKNLIKTIEIFQVHGARFNKVTIVNPRISNFQHDLLSYSITDKTLELNFTFEYEYAYYNTENDKLDAEQLQVFKAQYMEIANPTFLVTSSPSFIRSPVNKGSGKSRTGNNIQRALEFLGADFVSGNRITTSTSSLAGMLNIRPLPIKNILNPGEYVRSFKHTAIDNIKTAVFTSGKEVLQESVSSGEDFVVGNKEDGISTKKAYVPTDLSSPINNVRGRP